METNLEETLKSLDEEAVEFIQCCLDQHQQGADRDLFLDPKQNQWFLDGISMLGPQIVAWVLLPGVQFKNNQSIHTTIYGNAGDKIALHITEEADNLVRVLSPDFRRQVFRLLAIVWAISNKILPIPDEVSPSVLAEILPKGHRRESSE